MALPLSTVMALALQCGPTVAPTTLAAIARVESGYDPLAIGINGAHPQHLYPRSAAAAALTATRLIAAGDSVDLGLAQINSRNLRWLDLSVEAAFDPCANLTASARVLADGYARAVRAGATGAAALRIALSYYNTGSPERGVANGYVDRILAGDMPHERSGPAPSAGPQVQPAPAPRWDIFARFTPSADGFVFSPPPAGDTP